MTSTVLTFESLESLENSMLAKKGVDVYLKYLFNRYSNPIPYISESRRCLIDDTISSIKKFSRRNDNLNPLAIRIKSALQKLAVKVHSSNLIQFDEDVFMRNTINKLSSSNISQIDEFKDFFDLILCLINHMDAICEIQTIQKLITRLESKINKKKKFAY